MPRLVSLLLGQHRSSILKRRVWLSLLTQRRIHRKPQAQFVVPPQMEFGVVRLQLARTGHNGSIPQCQAIAVLTDNIPPPNYSFRHKLQLQYLPRIVQLHWLRALKSRLIQSFAIDQ